jgi:hypothetical protein
MTCSRNAREPPKQARRQAGTTANYGEERCKKKKKKAGRQAGRREGRLIE